MSEDDEPDIVLAVPDDILDEHDRRIRKNSERISNLERVRFMAEGAMAIMAIMVGSGGVVTLILRILGII